MPEYQFKVTLWEDSNDDAFGKLTDALGYFEINAEVNDLGPVPEDPWVEHPRLEDWKYQVANNDTRLGFWEWLVANPEEDECKDTEG